MTESERAYYEHRAPEYDDWYRGTGLYASRDRPGWHQEVERVRSILKSLTFNTVLDVACGTGFLTQCFPAKVTALDQSISMLKIARARLPNGAVLQGDALRLPFPAGSFDCLMAGHFYGHLAEPDRARFLEEAKRVAAKVLIVDAALRNDVQPEETQERVLNDGSQHSVFKRYFTPEQLQSELGGASEIGRAHV
jgi:ubiquinone/menaquinone biosynthesis C-methylase UbiE